MERRPERVVGGVDLHAPVGQERGHDGVRVRVRDGFRDIGLFDKYNATRDLILKLGQNLMKKKLYI